MNAKASIVSELGRDLVLPVVVAPMFLISGPELVIASANAGVIGCFPAPNARTIEDLKRWLEKIDRELSAVGKSGQWAINTIVHPSYHRFDQEIELIEEYKPKFVVTALGSPCRAIERVHRFGGKVFADVIGPKQARKAIDAGVDGLVLVCSGAGGHTGEYSPLAFVEEVRQFWNGPLIVGGAVQNARSILAMLTLGADFVYMGTRFIGCKESLVVDGYRDMLVRSTMQDIVTTAAVSGVKANWLRESLERVGINPEDVGLNKKADFSNLQGDYKAWKNIWGAGHGVGGTKEVQTVPEVVQELVREMRGLTAVQAEMIKLIDSNLDNALA